MSIASARTALLDTNVLVAMLAQEHQHHEASLALIEHAAPNGFLVAAHSYAEAFTTLTRRGDHAPFRREPGDAWVALESLAGVTRLIGLTPAQMFDGVRRYAASGGVGARIYDWLIGQAAIAASAEAVVTWNVRHLRSLFPNLLVLSPDEFAAQRPNRSSGLE